MGKTHDERKVLASLARIGKVDHSNKTVTIHGVAGIHRLGMIDYLTKHCGWFVRIGKASPMNFSTSNETSVREAKKAKKEHKRQNKRK